MCNDIRAILQQLKLQVLKWCVVWLWTQWRTEQSSSTFTGKVAQQWRRSMRWKTFMVMIPHHRLWLRIGIFNSNMVGRRYEQLLFQAYSILGLARSSIDGFPGKGWSPIIIGSYYASLLRKLRKRCGMLTKGVQIEAWCSCGFEILPHLSYFNWSRIIGPPLPNNEVILEGQAFARWDSDFRSTWLSEQPVDFFKRGVNSSLKRCEKCSMPRGGNYAIICQVSLLLVHRKWV